MTTLPRSLTVTTLTIAALLAQPVQAVDQLADPPLAAPQAADQAAPPPMPRDDRESIEPEVTIIRKADRTIEEYRVNGQLYMVKITPSKGLPYYLMDADGDGNLETRSNELDPKILVPSWVIFSW